MTASTYQLHVIEEPGHAEVWLDTGLEPHDGVLVGAGETVAEAIDSAIDECTETLVKLASMREDMR